MSIGKKIFILSLLITLTGTIIFLALIPIDYSFVIGWLVGSTSVIMTYLMGLFFIKVLLKKKSFKRGMFMTFARIFIVFAFHIVIIISIIAINKAVSGYSINEVSSASVMYNPINIFTYIGGVSIVAISTFIDHISIKKKRGALNE